MSSKWYHQILFFILLILLQVWFFSRIHLFNFATPLPYIYFIAKLPSNMNRNVVLLLSFLLGFFIDLFGYTMGINALASTIAGFSRYYSLQLFTPKDLPQKYTPSVQTLGSTFFQRYIGFILLIHEFVFFLVETFSLFDPVILLIRFLSSFVLTFILVIVFERFNFNFQKE